jgi:apolipoprotein D and lipocalin family protein
VLDPDYKWVLIGEPQRKFGWILSRTPSLDQGTLKLALDRAAELGFNRGEFRETPQTQPLQ